MVIFVDDDELYRSWLKANPDGFVVNTERVPVAHYLKLHRAGCKHIQDYTHQNPTSTGFIKACALTTKPLAEWARTATGGGKLAACPTCAPASAAAAHRPVTEPKSAPVQAAATLPDEELGGRFTAAVAELSRHFARDLDRLEDDNVVAELKGWLDGKDQPLEWAGAGVSPDEWFFITTLYGMRTRDQQRALIRNYFPRFVAEAERDLRKLTPAVTMQWQLDQDWMAPRLLKMARILRDRRLSMTEYVAHLRQLEAKATPENPMPALDAIIQDHQAGGWKTLSVFVRDCVGGNCFPIDSRVAKELARHGLPSGNENERLLVSLCLSIGRSPRQVARMFYEAGGVGGNYGS